MTRITRPHRRKVKCDCTKHREDHFVSFETRWRHQSFFPRRGHSASPPGTRGAIQALSASELHEGSDGDRIQDVRDEDSGEDDTLLPDISFAKESRGDQDSDEDYSLSHPASEEEALGDEHEDDLLENAVDGYENPIYDDGTVSWELVRLKALSGKKPFAMLTDE
jgi:hypothetical protein